MFQRLAMLLDASRSRLAIYTEAEGLLSALAHDLELLATDLQGEVTGNEASLRVSPGSIRVSGVMKRGKLDAGVLSPNDRTTIERQIAIEILAVPEVVARGVLEGARATIEVVTARARTRIACPVSVLDEGAGKRARGCAEVSLAALGAPPVKGPMGAFRVKDRVRVEFDLVFA